MGQTRKILGIIAIMALLLSNALFVGQAVAVVDDLPLREEPPLPPGPEEEYIPDQIIVKFKETTLRSVEASLNETLGTEVIYTSPFAGFKVLKIPEGKTVAEMVEAYSGQAIVEYAEPNYIRLAIWSPNDPGYYLQWHFDQINLEAAWDLDTTAPNYGGDPSIIVAILDTGVAYETYGGYVQAPDLADTNFTSGWDFVNNDAHPNDDDSHGTHVCGTIAQSTNNSLGVAGIAFNTTIMPVKILPGGIAEEADGIYYATDNGAQIINMSIGSPGTNNTERDALAYAYSHGVTIICAAGNDYETGNDPLYPAAYDDYCIAVGAVRFDQTHAYYSNTGSYLDIAAPGGDRTVDQNGDGYVDGVLQQTFAEGDPTDFGYYFLQGTSMACPHVTGVAALILAKNPTWTPDQVRQALESTATDLGDLGRDDVYGWGLIDALAAVGLAPNTPPGVTNVIASQGSPVVDISYDVSDAEQSQVSISFEYWDGASWQACITTTGDGTQTTGTGKSGTWNAKADFDEHYMTDCKIRVTADDGQAENNIGSAESSAFTLDTKDPTGYGCSTPADGATDVSINPDLTCLTASDDSPPISYYFQLAENDTFSLGLQESGWQTSLTWSPSTLDYKQHFWKVKVKDDYGNETDYSSSFNFTTEWAPNTPPVVSNVTASQGSPTVDISYDVSDAEQSQVSISFEYWDGASWQACITTTGEGTQSTGTGKSGTWDAQTDFDEHYMPDCKIRVTADDGQVGNNIGSGQSNAFSLDTKDPTGYGCSTPANGATGVSINPDLTCVTASDDSPPISYYFQLAENDTFSLGLQESGWQTSLTWSPSTLDYKQHFWRVKAKDNYGNETDYCSRFNFTTEAGSYDIELGAGWNLISLPLIPDDPAIDVVLAEISDSVNIVRQYYNNGPEDQGWLWYQPGVAESTLSTMEDGKGYWINMSSPATLAGAGSQMPPAGELPPTYAVSEGWNLIGFKSVEALDNTIYLVNFVTETIPTGYSVLWGYEPDEGYFNVHPMNEHPGDNAIGDMEVGHGYWLWATGDGIIVVPTG